nr:centrosomal protein C10orf90-like [Odocoileus virginianus texanus]
MSLKHQWNMIKLSEEGLRDSQYSPHDQIALKNLQSDVPERRSDFTEGTLASQNTKMISSIVISQLIDENKSKENGAALPMPCACPMKPSLANRSRVTINRALEFLPGGLGIQTPAGEPGLKTKPPPKEEKPCSGSQKGFASITITARRVGAPASTLVWEAVGDPLCVKCRARDALLGDPSALAGRADPSQQHGPFTCTEFSRNSCVMGLKVPEAHAQLCEGHGYWITNVDHGEDHFSPGTLRSRAGKSPLLFSSCVHLRVSQSCPNPIYSLDRSLSVPVEPPRLAGPKTHRSVLSLNLSCSAHRLTPDGGDDTEIREPRRGALRPALREGDEDLLGPRWNLGLQGSFSKENPSLGQVHFGNLGTGRCPWRGSPPLENAEVGSNQITVRKRKEDQAAHCPARGHDQAHQLSIHIPGWSYTAEDPARLSQSAPTHRAHPLLGHWTSQKRRQPLS